MIGDMKHRIILIEPKRIDNGRGGWKLNYADGTRHQVWAAADLLSINKQLQYQKYDKAATTSFIIRENPALHLDTQIIFEGRTYEVVQFAPTNKRFLEVRAREV